MIRNKRRSRKLHFVFESVVKVCSNDAETINITVELLRSIHHKFGTLPAIYYTLPESFVLERQRDRIDVSPLIQKIRLFLRNFYRKRCYN